MGFPCINIFQTVLFIIDTIILVQLPGFLMLYIFSNDRDDSFIMGNYPLIFLALGICLYMIFYIVNMVLEYNYDLSLRIFIRSSLWIGTGFGYLMCFFEIGKGLYIGIGFISIFFFWISIFFDIFADLKINERKQKPFKSIKEEVDGLGYNNNLLENI